MIEFLHGPLDGERIDLSKQVHIRTQFCTIVVSSRIPPGHVYVETTHRRYGAILIHQDQFTIGNRRDD